MKNKLFKTVKPMLSIAVAVAILAVSLFAAVPGISFSASAATVTDTWDGTLATSFASGTGTKDDPYIIATAEQLAYAALGASTVSVGKYFKVVDNATFNLSGMTDITLDSTVGDVMVAATDKNWRPVSDGMKTFAGYFDGNGLVVYNMYCGGHGFTGLFPRPDNNNANKTSWIKNITLVASRSIGYHNAGGIVGAYEAPDTARTASIENCKVLNCWISDNNSTAASQKISGIIAGTITHNTTTIKNCFASGNVTSATEISGGLIGQTSAYAPSVSIQNCIVLGSLPYPTVTGNNQKINKHLDVPGTYASVYTDQDVDAAYAVNQVKKVAEADMKGPDAKNNMPDLDWGTWIAFEGELPDYRANHTLELEQNDNATHNITCTDCGKAMAETHTFVENATGTVGECACGYSAPITERRTDVWDGSYDNNFPAGDGTKNNPYIVKTAEQMAYVALKTTPAESAGKYYQVAPNMIFNMNGMVGITLDSTAEEVKNAVEGKDWVNDTNKFAGNFDGNGVIVYNVRSSNGRSNGYSALFPRVNTDNPESTVTIKNITVMASRFKGYHYSAGIVAVADCSVTKQLVFVENCAVKNCYIGDGGNTNAACSRTAAAIIGSIGNNIGTIDNCLSVNNILDGTDISGGFIASAGAYGDYATITNSVMIGNMPYPELMPNAADGKSIHDYVVNINCFKNVYTDQPTSGYAKAQIRTLTLDMMSGVSAPQNMSLDFGKYWFANKGVLDLLVCHNIEGDINPDDGYAGHTAVCKACGLAGVVILNHQYTDEYNCTVCGFTCDHKNTEYHTVTEYKENDCVTPKHTKTECACGYANQVNHSEASGHKLEKTEAKAPTCATAGNVEYYTCENCECIFLTDDVMAPYEDAVTEADVALSATGIHTEIKDSKGEIVYFMDDESHWITCEVCLAKLKRVEHTIKFTDDGAASHDGICEICLYEVAENAAHTFLTDSEKCRDCKWICTHVDTIEEVKVSEPTCSMEGVGTAHYRCTVCDVRFSDAAATTEIEKETVVIEKLGHDHIDFDVNGTPVHEFNETHHWYNCNVCGKGDYAEHTMLEDSENYEGTYRWCEDETGYGCKYSTFDYYILDEENRLQITAPTDAFTKDVITDIFAINKDDLIYEDIKAVFDKTGQRYFFPYEISPSEEIASGNSATIIMEIPNDLGLNAALYLVDIESGKLQKMPTSTKTILLDKAGNLIDENDSEDIKKAANPINIATITVDKFGYFMLTSADTVIEDADNSGNINGDNSTTSPPTGENVIFPATIIAILASATVLFVRKAKI